MRVGFTGTRRGLTARQRIAVKAWLDQLSVVYATDDVVLIGQNRALLDQNRILLHGGCVGADAEVHELALDRGYDVEVFWGDDRKQQAPLRRAIAIAGALRERMTAHEPKPMLERNKDIVNGCDVLLVAPRTRKEVLRSGTWATYRYAQKVGRDCIMLWP